MFFIILNFSYFKSSNLTLASRIPTETFVVLKKGLITVRAQHIAGCVKAVPSTSSLCSQKTNI